MRGDLEAASILVVEDNDGDAYLIRRALDRSLPPAARVRVLPDGLAALKHLDRVAAGEAERPAAIVLDLNLPGLTGVEVLRRIRGRAQCADLPVVVFTSSKREEDERATKELGAAAYLVKPFDPDGFFELATLVRGLVDRSAA